MPDGRICSINISSGGVPKLPVALGVVGPLGLQGDRQRDHRFHGGPDRALCLYSLECIQRLQAAGHPIAPGSVGENLTLSGLDWQAIVPGIRLQLGAEVLAEITSYTTPCANIQASFIDGDFSRILQKAHPGESRVYARVLRGGPIYLGDPVRPAARQP